MIPLQYVKTNGQKVVVNLFEIACVEQFENHARILLKNGHKLRVVESASEIEMEITDSLNAQEMAYE